MLEYPLYWRQLTGGPRQHKYLVGHLNLGHTEMNHGPEVSSLGLAVGQKIKRKEERQEQLQYLVINFQNMILLHRVRGLHYRIDI
jgi:hypothetical protein